MYPTFICTHCFWPGYQLLFRKSPKRQSTLWRSSRTFGMWLISASEVSATSGAFLVQVQGISRTRKRPVLSPLLQLACSALSPACSGERGWDMKCLRIVGWERHLGRASDSDSDWEGDHHSTPSPPPHCPALGKLPRNRNINSIQLPPYYLALPNTLIIIPQFYSPSILQTILKD